MDNNILLEPEAIVVLTSTRYHFIYSMSNKITKPISEVHKTANLNLTVRVKQRDILAKGKVIPLQA
jgi:hypothetical protein